MLAIRHDGLEHNVKYSYNGSVELTDTFAIRVKLTSWRTSENTVEGDEADQKDAETVPASPSSTLNNSETNTNHPTRHNR